MQHLHKATAAAAVALALVWSATPALASTTGHGRVGTPLACATDSSDTAERATCRQAVAAGLTHEKTVTFAEFTDSSGFTACRFGGSARVAFAPGRSTAMVIAHSITNRPLAGQYRCGTDRIGEVRHGVDGGPVRSSGASQAQDGRATWATWSTPSTSTSSRLVATIEMRWDGGFGQRSRSVTTSLDTSTDAGAAGASVPGISGADVRADAPGFVVDRQALSCSTSAATAAERQTCQRAVDAGLGREVTVVMPSFQGSGFLDVCRYSGSVRVAYAPGTGRAMVLGQAVELRSNTGYQCAVGSDGRVVLQTSGGPTVGSPRSIEQDGAYRWATWATPSIGSAPSAAVTMQWDDSLRISERTMAVPLTG